MQKNAATKLASCESSIKRWHTRLVRATNALTKLNGQRRRLLATNTTPPKAPTAATPAPKPDQPAPAADVVMQAVEAIEDAGLKIPAFLKRRDVVGVVAEQMTKTRKATETEARKKMPLTGRAAIEVATGKPTRRRAVPK